MPSLRRLQQYAIAISVASIIWNGVEGGLSIGFGAETSSHSLTFFGIQSAIEVISAIIVVWRFIHVAKPGEEEGVCLSPRELKFEKYSTISIGCLLVALAIATVASASVGFAMHFEPDASTPALAIAASSLVIMLLIWLPKRSLARSLNSAAMQSEATCSLACIQITLALFIGALAFRLRRTAWWLDGATSLVLAVLFAMEGGKMLRWACDPKFDGGCCDHRGRGVTAKDVEMAQYVDLCPCCEEKEACKSAEACQCGAETQGCCERRDGEKCCTRELRTGVRSVGNSPNEVPACEDQCCTPSIPPATSELVMSPPSPANANKARADGCANECCTNDITMKHHDNSSDQRCVDKCCD